MKKTIKIATRKSPLALWQAEEVKRRLQEAHAGLNVELVTMVTQGDKLLDSPLAKIGGKGLFVKELEQGMLQGDADIAVHSMKDVPVHLPEGLHLSTIMVRENPYDAFVSNHYDSLEALPADARVGTCSLRRQCQIKARFPNFEILDLRGNVNSRLAKLDAGNYDAIILACAGLIRLGMEDRITAALSPEQSLPAVGQGAIGIECRIDDEDTNALLASLHDDETATRLTAERAMNERLNGGCQVPIACHAELQANGEMLVRGLVGTPDGLQMITSDVVGQQSEAAALGVQVAEELLAQGADKVLKQVGIITH